MIIIKKYIVRYSYKQILCYFSGNFVPKTKKTVYYIVGAILINDAGQILMIQEAKYSCYGQWYLPCGRVEREESFVVCIHR